MQFTALAFLLSAFATAGVNGQDGGSFSVRIPSGMVFPDEESGAYAQVSVGSGGGGAAREEAPSRRGEEEEEEASQGEEEYPFFYIAAEQDQPFEYGRYPAYNTGIWNSPSTPTTTLATTTTTREPESELCCRMETVCRPNCCCKRSCRTRPDCCCKRIVCFKSEKPCPKAN